MTREIKEKEGSDGNHSLQFYTCRNISLLQMFENVIYFRITSDSQILSKTAFKNLFCCENLYFFLFLSFG